MHFLKQSYTLLHKRTKLLDLSPQPAAQSFTISLVIATSLNIDQLYPCFPEQNSARRGSNYFNLSMLTLFVHSQFGLKPLLMNIQVGKICSKAFYSLCNIRPIRKFLSPESTKILAPAFVTWITLTLNYMELLNAR